MSACSLSFPSHIVSLGERRRSGLRILFGGGEREPGSRRKRAILKLTSQDTVIVGASWCVQEGRLCSLFLSSRQHTTVSCVCVLCESSDACSDWQLDPNGSTGDLFPSLPFPPQDYTLWHCLRAPSRDTRSRSLFS